MEQITMVNLPLTRNSPIEPQSIWIRLERLDWAIEQSTKEGLPPSTLISVSGSVHDIAATMAQIGKQCAAASRSANASLQQEMQQMQNGLLVPASAAGLNHELRRLNQ